MSSISGMSYLVSNWTDSWPPSGPGNQTGDAGFPYSLPEMTLIAIVAGFLSLLTVVGNCMVMISFKIDKQLQTISNYFLFSLAVADFAIGLISMPLYTVYILTGSWQLGPHTCDTWLSLDYLASNASVLNLLIISFDRYFSVTRPLTYRARRTPRRAGIMIAAAWLISLVLWPPWIYSWPYIEGQRTVPEGECYIQFFETNNYITFGTAIAAFYVPVTVMCILYWKVWRETEKRQKDLSNLQAGKKNDSHRSNSSNEEQAAIEVDEWRRSRSESSGAIDEIETTYVPASAYLTGSRHRRQRIGWHSIRNWRRWLSWSTFRRLLWCRSRHHGAQYDDESCSDASNVATPGSVETPLTSSVSHGVAVNAIRDPYSQPRHRAASRSLSTGVADASPCSDIDPLSNRAQSADSVFTILIRLPRHPDKEEHPTIRMIPANPAQHRPKAAAQSQQHHPPASRPRSVPLGPLPPGPSNAKLLSNSSSLLCGTNLQLTEAFSLSKLASLAKPNQLPLKGAKLKSNASPWVPRSCMPVAQSPLLPRSGTRFPSDGTPSSDNAVISLDTKIIPKQFARPAVNTVSGTVSTPQTPNRRNRYHVYNPQAAAAKKNAKKPKKKKNQEKKQERKAAKTLSAILLAFILTWTPYNVLILLKALANCDNNCFPEALWNFSYYLCYINSTINPVCYALCNASFRRTYVRIVTCKWHSRTKTAVQRGFYN